MTTLVEARDALVAHINAGWIAQYPSIKIFYEDTVEIDLDKAGDIFIVVAIDMQHISQASMGASPLSRVIGEVNFRIMAREGGGARAVLQKNDFLIGLMKYKDIGGVTTGVPKPGRKLSKDGWTSTDLNVRFSTTFN